MKIKSAVSFIIVAFCFLCNQTYSQTPATFSSADIYLQLKKLNVLGSVLYIAAHPDDENTRLLAYLSKEKLYRTGYLSLTRGDGGQNLIGNEQGIELGLIRTQELLAARRIDGAEQFFSRAYDFGFSKHAEEAMRIWGHDKILSDVVWVIRNFQPDVIITRFPGDERAGHGHHAASALLANEAFTAAADPNKFPEQLQYIKPWKAQRILWNTFNFGSTNTTAEDQLKLDVGAYNSLLGKGYGEIASESRSQHKSQGFGVPRQRGSSVEYFKTTGGDAPKTNLFENINADWSRLEGGKEIQASVDKIISEYSFEHPERSVGALVNLYTQIKRSGTGYWQNKKLQEVQQIIEACAGLFVEATTATDQVVQGDSLRLNVLLNKRNNIDATFKGVVAYGQLTGNKYDMLKSVDSVRKLITNENVNVTIKALLPDNISYSQPYWLQHQMETGSFNITEQQQIGKAQSDAVFSVKVYTTIEGEDFVIARDVQYKYTDPVKGEVFQPVVIMPKLTVQEDPSLVIMNKGETEYNRVKYKAQATLPVVEVTKQHKTWLVDTVTMQKGEERMYKTKIPLKNIKVEGTDPGIMSIDSFNIESDKPAVYPVSIHYEHIPNITYFKPAVQKVLALNVKTAGKLVGYIPGAGDKVIPALEQMGYTVVTLKEEDITAQSMQQLDAVITGIRAYNTNEFLSAKYNELMNYVRNGGNLIVQYNTNSQIGPVKAKISPYPFNISRTRVTDETAEVKFDLPNHPVLNFPNKITAKDFEGWIQERSIYEAEQVDSNFVAPLSMADPGEKPTNGSLVIAKYGKGNFVYTGLVFFRELPAGVPGAYRLMANLIALPKSK